MTTINKMTIRGIRSFGCEMGDEQKIEFSSPLTLIVGQNGCGKTTVIECLKYALTGDKPPGTDGGRSFVHDPNISKTKVCLGQVRLTVTNQNMVEKTIVRSMRCEVTKTNKVKFETLDSTICTIDPLKGRNDLSGRVEDINANMCQFMGVSKAIINNVIFCHQEDSNWPLDEGKKLKEKFDAIFGTTEYNKAIDKFIKMRKKFQEELLEMNGVKRYNEEIKDQAEKKEYELKNQQKRCEEINEQLEEAQARMAELEKKKEEIQKRENALSDVVAKRNRYKSMIETKSDDYNSLKCKIKRELSGTIEDLENQLRKFKEDQDKKTREKKKIEADIAEVNGEERKQQQEASKCTAKIAGISDKITTMQDLEGDKFEKMQKICEKLDIPFDGLDQSVDTQQVSGTFETVKEKIEEMEENLEIMKVDASEKDHEFQVKIDKLREEHTKLNTEIANLQKFIDSTRETRNKIKEEIDASEKSIPMLNQLKPKIAEAEKKLEKLKNENQKIQGLKDSQDILESDKIELDEELRQIEGDIEILHSASKITDELELKKNDLNRDQKEFDRIKNKLSPTLKTIFEREIPDSNYRMKVTKKKESLENEVRSLKDQLLTLQRDNDRTQERRSNLKKQIETKTAELKKIQDNIDDVCNGKNYISYLTAQKEQVAKSSMELAVLRSSENTYKDYINKIKDAQNPNCPVCHKNLEDHENEELQIEMEEKIQELPKKIDAIEKKLKKEQSVYDKLNSYKSAYDSIEKLNNEKSKLESDFKKADDQIKENTEKKEILESQLVDPEDLLGLISSTFVGDAMKLDDLQRNISNKTKEVDAINSRVPKNIPKISLNDAKEKRKNLSESIKSKNDELKKIGDQIKRHQDDFNEAHSVVNNLNAQKNKFQEKVQGIDRLKEQLKQLETDKAENEQKRRESEKKLGPVKQQLDKVTSEKQKARDESAKNISKYQKNLDDVKMEKIAIDRVIQEMQKYQIMNLHDEYKEQQKSLRRANDKITELKKKEDELKKKLKDIEADIANEETTKRNIEDNIDLQRIEKLKQEFQDKLSELEKQFGDADFSKFKRDRQNVNSEIEKHNIEIGKLSGMYGTLKGSSEKMQEELNDKKYKDAVKNYLESVYQVNLLQATIDDLAKYRIALEKALLKFHQDKMDQINHLLKEYWNSIYSGNDIDYIMIKTDEEENLGTIKLTNAAASTEKKRSYNYRVVMGKGLSEVDMRGRCSAGQKVLASLIIRMALAETFSLSCGILALDEPTTNLDSANVESLCSALQRIVEERDDDTGKFMLIVITHDEDFANALGRTDHFWKLSRTRGGLSQIERINNY